jgi:pimeloyl-ACP methyl ester carboxylesterase
MAFQENGLIEAVHARGFGIDMIATHAHIGYYVHWSILARLEQDVILPAKAKGYSQIWLVGDSLGAYGALSYAKAHPNDISGVVLLGPYLGEKALLNEIKQAGGLDVWQPGEASAEPREQWERGLWAWLKDCRTKKVGCPIIYLGYGTGDRFAYAQEYLASLLRPDQVIAIDGGHVWRTWRKIWDTVLDRNIFQ